MALKRASDSGSHPAAAEANQGCPMSDTPSTPLLTPLLMLPLRSAHRRGERGGPRPIEAHASAPHGGEPFSEDRGRRHVAGLVKSGANAAPNASAARASWGDGDTRRLRKPAELRPRRDCFQNASIRRQERPPSPMAAVCGSRQEPLIQAVSAGTERAGFEPAMEFDPHTRLAGECLQPLGHLSRRSGVSVAPGSQCGGPAGRRKTARRRPTVVASGGTSSRTGTPEGWQSG